jgi:hypothetical protein
MDDASSNVSTQGVNETPMTQDPFSRKADEYCESSELGS